MNCRVIAFLIAALALGACSGNFGTGTSLPQQGGGLPPVGASPLPANNANGLPETAVSATPSASPAAYAIAQAQTGFACPATIDGYACKLSFNLPPPTPAPSPTASPNGKRKATPTPSPSPTPTPTPSPLASGSASPSPSPTPSGGTVTLKAQALPTNAPKMVHVPQNSLDVVPLMMVTLEPNADFPLDGWVNAQFTLPKEQTTDRAFAVQLFSQATKKKNVSYTPIWTFDNFTLQDSTLLFSFKPPKMKIAKNSTYVLVLYGDDKSKTSASPSSSPSPTPSDSASTSPGPSPSPT